MFKNNHFNQAFTTLRIIYTYLQELEDLTQETELIGTARYDRLADILEQLAQQADGAFLNGTADLVAAIRSRDANIIKTVK